MKGQRIMDVRMEPQTIVLKVTEPKVVHDVGEIVEIPVAEGMQTVTVHARDAERGDALEATVHLGSRKVPANQPFEHTFHSELDRKNQTWSRELIWVECSGYENADIDYEVKVKAEP